MADVESAKAVDAIITDIRDRRGLRQEWEAIDADIRAEIREVWAGIVEAAREAARREAFEEAARTCEWHARGTERRDLYVNDAIGRTYEMMGEHFRALATGKGAG